MTSIQHGVDMIAVEWRDAMYDPGWWDLDQPIPNTKYVVTTSGYFTHETDEVIVVSLDWEERMNRHRHWTVIPKVNIIRQKRWKLRMPAEKIHPLQTQSDTQKV